VLDDCPIKRKLHAGSTSCNFTAALICRFGESAHLCDPYLICALLGFNIAALIISSRVRSMLISVHFPSHIFISLQLRTESDIESFGISGSRCVSLRSETTELTIGPSLLGCGSVIAIDYLMSKLRPFGRRECDDQLFGDYVRHCARCSTKEPFV